MRSNIRLAALLATSFLASATLASAQGNNAAGGQVGSSGVIMSPGASSSPPPAVTTGTGGVSQPGAPGSTNPGRIGTGASPSGLAGDNPAAPGFPGKVGR